MSIVPVRALTGHDLRLIGNNVLPIIRLEREAKPACACGCSGACAGRCGKHACHCSH